MRQRGFTLIELLISITLVAALSVGMLYALRTGLLTMSKVDMRLDQNRYAAGIQQLVERQIEGAIPMRGDCQLGSGRTLVSIFSGTPETLHFVSSYSMNEGARGYPRLVEYQVFANPDGTKRLVMNEALYSGPGASAPFCLNGSFPPGMQGPQSLVIADHLALAQFSYREINVETGLPGNWFPEWRRTDMPIGLRIAMEPAVVDPGQIPLTSMTFPLHVTRQVQQYYGE